MEGFLFRLLSTVYDLCLFSRCFSFIVFVFCSYVVLNLRNKNTEEEQEQHLLMNRRASMTDSGCRYLFFISFCLNVLNTKQTKNT